MLSRVQKLQLKLPRTKEGHCPRCPWCLFEEIKALSPIRKNPPIKKFHKVDPFAEMTQYHRIHGVINNVSKTGTCIGELSKQFMRREDIFETEEDHSESEEALIDRTFSKIYNSYDFGLLLARKWFFCRSLYGSRARWDMVGTLVVLLHPKKEGGKLLVSDGNKKFTFFSDRIHAIKRSTKTSWKDVGFFDRTELHAKRSIGNEPQRS